MSTLTNSHGSALLIIDGGYLSAQCMEIRGRIGWEERIHLDHGKFKEWAFGAAGANERYDSIYIDGRPVVNPRLEGDQRQAAQVQVHKVGFFWERLDQAGYTIRLGHTYWRNKSCCGRWVQEQKQVDGLVFYEIASHLMDKSGVMHFILVAGDEDHVPAVRFARRRGSRVTLIHGVAESRVLKEEVDDHIYVTRGDLAALQLSK